MICIIKSQRVRRLVEQTTATTKASVNRLENFEKSKLLLVYI